MVIKKCFKCGFSGDIIDLYQQHYGADYNTALTMLAQECGITIDPYRPDAAADFAPAADQRKKDRPQERAFPGGNPVLRGQHRGLDFFAPGILIAQRALLTKEKLDALEDENEALKKDVAVAKDNEKKLRAQVDDLNAENERIRREALARAQQVTDNLNGVLDQLKADQLTYYAIPFSVLYPNDSWHVTDAEMIKVKAVSRVMKDNPDLKLTVVGFCDYTASDEYNMKLSQKRAEEVKRIMVKKYGIDPDRLTVDWKGKTVAFGDIHYELNRRVSFYRVIE